MSKVNAIELYYNILFNSKFYSYIGKFNNNLIVYK